MAPTAGFTVLEAMAGPGGMSRQAFNFLNEDNHCEILKYTCADVNGYWGAKSPDKAAAANVQFKVSSLTSSAQCVSDVAMPVDLESLHSPVSLESLHLSAQV